MQTIHVDGGNIEHEEKGQSMNEFDNENDPKILPAGEEQIPVKDQGSLRDLFQNLNFLPSQTTSDESKDLNTQQVEGEDDILQALDLGRIVLNEEEDDNHRAPPLNEDLNAEDESARRKEMTQREQIVQRLANSLRQQMDLDKSNSTDEMYQEMARAMLKCRIKDALAVANDGISSNVTEPTQ